MPASSVNDFVNKVNTTKTKSSGKINVDNSAQLTVTYTNGSTAVHTRAIIDVGQQTITLGDGSGVRVCNIDQFLNQLQ